MPKIQKERNILETLFVESQRELFDILGIK